MHKTIKAKQPALSSSSLERTQSNAQQNKDKHRTLIQHNEYAPSKDSDQPGCAQADQSICRVNNW